MRNALSAPRASSPADSGGREQCHAGAGRLRLLGHFNLRQLDVLQYFELDELDLLMDQRARLVGQVLDQFESRSLPEPSAIDARHLRTSGREAPLRLRDIATAIAPRALVATIGRSLHEARSDESGEDTDSGGHPRTPSRKALEIHRASGPPGPTGDMRRDPRHAQPPAPPPSQGRPCLHCEAVRPPTEGRDPSPALARPLGSSAGRVAHEPGSSHPRQAHEPSSKAALGRWRRAPRPFPFTSATAPPGRPLVCSVAIRPLLSLSAEGSSQRAEETNLSVRNMTPSE